MDFDTAAALGIVLVACWTLLRRMRAPSGCAPCQPDTTSPGRSSNQHVAVDSLGLSKPRRSTSD